MIKPGTLCIVKGSKWNDGKITTVISLHPPGYDKHFVELGMVATVDCEIIGKWTVTEKGYVSNTLLLIHLQPLDNPPDDAIDETLLWLPVPQEELTT